MMIFLEMRRLGGLGLAPVLLAALAALPQGGAGQASPPAQSPSGQGSASQNPQGQKSQGQSSQPVPLKPGVPGMARNHRLILKDGNYQMVRDYQIVGDRVRYLSQERGEWEELPASLVDWDATRKWEKEHADLVEEDASPAMKEAEELDKEESQERNEQSARMPQVAEGLELPDEDGVFILDTYQGTPELAELIAKDLSLNAKSRK